MAPLMDYPVRWLRQGEAAIVSMRGESMVLRSTVSSPPGSRIEGVVALEPPVTLRVKIHGCRRQPEGDFLLDARPLDLTREARARLEATVVAKAVPPLP